MNSPVNCSDPKDQLGGCSQDYNFTCGDHKTTKVWERNQARGICDRNMVLFISHVFSDLELTNISLASDGLRRSIGNTPTWKPKHPDARRLSQ